MGMGSWGEKKAQGIPTLFLCPLKEGCLIPVERLTLASAEPWKAPAEGGSAPLALRSQAGTLYEGYIKAQAPRNALLCHQMLQS